jgi:hypothetical protein
MKLKKVKNNHGFVLLIAVTLAAILLSIALGAGQIALKENNFSTSAKDTDNAFYAADTGSEYVLYQDANSAYLTHTGMIYTWPTIYISNLGGNNISCAIVTITKDDTVSPTATSVISKGYNNGGGCSASSPPPASAVERELDTTY